MDTRKYTQILDCYEAKWKPLLTSTDDYDVKTVEEAIATIYKEVHVDVPKRFLHFYSPLAGLNYVASRDGSSSSIGRWTRRNRGWHSPLSNRRLHMSPSWGISSWEDSNLIPVKRLVISGIHRWLQTKREILIDIPNCYLFSTILDQLLRSFGRMWHQNCFYGSLDAPDVAFLDSLDNELNLSSVLTRAFIDVSKQCGWWWPLDDVCVISRKPSRIQLDADENLHADGEKAIEYADGFGIYSWHGTTLPYHIGRVKSTEWRPDWLIDETDPHIRRVLIQVMGYTKIAKTLPGNLLDKKHDMEMREINIPTLPEPLVLLSVRCPSTGKEHTLRVPPLIDDCEKARQWSMHNDEGELNFVKET